MNLTSEARKLATSIDLGKHCLCCGRNLDPTCYHVKIAYQIERLARAWADDGRAGTELVRTMTGLDSTRSNVR